MSQLPTRLWFQPGEGIAREVIQADIQRYLGPDALVKPGQNEGLDGYWITAYRTLTSQMVQDLKADSLRWRHERSQGRGSPVARDRPSSTQPDKLVGAYEHSDTHKSRQYYGPSATTVVEEAAHHQYAPASVTYPPDARSQPHHRQQPPPQVVPQTHSPQAPYPPQQQQYSYPTQAPSTYVLQGAQYVQAPAPYGTQQEPRSAYPQYPTQPAAPGQAQYPPSAQDPYGYRPTVNTTTPRDPSYPPQSQRYHWYFQHHYFGQPLNPL